MINMHGSIAHFILDMGNGGAERLVRILSQKLVINHYQNEVVCLDNIKDYSEEFHHLNIPLTLIKRRQRWFDTAILPSLIRHIKKSNIKLIHAHDMSSLTYALISGRMTGTKVIMTEHSRHYIDEAWKRRLEKWVLAAASDYWIEVSPELQKASRKKDKLCTRHLDVIENGVDVDMFSKARPLKFISDIEPSEDTTALLFVGRLEDIKGPQYLIQALASEHLQDKKISLFMVGMGNQHKPLQALVRKLNLENTVRFLGIRKNIPELMKSCDVLVIPSESEGLPFTLLEGMAASIPVVATEVGRIPEIIGDHERGRLVPAKSPDELALAVLDVIHNPALARLRAKRAKEFVSAYYSQRTMIHKYQKVYKSLI